MLQNDIIRAKIIMMLPVRQLNALGAYVNWH